MYVDMHDCVPKQIKSNDLGEQVLTDKYGMLIASMLRQHSFNHSNWFSVLGDHKSLN